MKKIFLLVDFIGNMGWRYIMFRVIYALKVKIGILKWYYPTTPFQNNTMSLADWRKSALPFFIECKEVLPKYKISEEARITLNNEYQSYLKGELTFFNARKLNIGLDYDWLTNPYNGIKYDSTTFWANIPDLDPIKGDIKYVWEKSRFSFLYMLIRYDYHFDSDQSEMVFNNIEDWINKNQPNCGPNYKCSQEISLRVLNWIYALYYYKNSKILTETLFFKILNSIELQIKHVETNIDFSRIAVRNNHALTETLTLYLVGLLFPKFADSSRWKAIGKKYFEQEVEYQIYEDGTFLQFSHNYHRVAVQLFTWAQLLAKKNNETWSEKVLDRFTKSFQLLQANQDIKTGYLPNYGANDGALFFKLNSADYRNFYPQLNALNYSLNNQTITNNLDWVEDIFWYGATTIQEQTKVTSNSCISKFEKGGFYVLRNTNGFTAVRCGSHKDRPQQADNLTMDIWYEGKNLIRDNGSYMYNTDPALLNYFTGTASHSTVMLGKHNQMQKGGRFIWYYWSQALGANTSETSSDLIFEGKIQAFAQIKEGIVHSRKIMMHKLLPQWDIEDKVDYSKIKNKRTNLHARQLWHIHPDFFKDGFEISSVNEYGHSLNYVTIDVWHSSFYGVKEQSKCLVFENEAGYFYTTIKRNNINGN